MSNYKKMLSFFLLAVVVSVFSGLYLLISIEFKEIFISISSQLISSPFFSYIRSLHYWSSFLILLSAALFFASYEKNKIPEYLFSASFILFIIGLIFLTGHLLRGDYSSLLDLNLIENSIGKLIDIGGNSATNLGENSVFQQLIFISHLLLPVLLFIMIYVLFPSNYIFNSYKNIYGNLLITFIPPLIFSPGFLPIIDNNLGVIEGDHFPIIQILILGSGVIISLIFIALWLILKRHYLIERLGNLFVFLPTVCSIFILIYFSLFGNATDKLPKTDLLVYNPALINSIINSQTSNKDKVFPLLNNFPEACLNCHNKMTGFSKFHSPADIGCFRCHFGNPFSLDKSAAHSGLIKIPGNLVNSDFSCGTSSCHQDLVMRVNYSLMNSLNGLIRVNKKVFADRFPADTVFYAAETGNTPSDNHLRQLCVGCHLDNEKILPGRAADSDRGGGCLACHLKYQGGLEIRTGDSMHPALTIDTDDSMCFGCHARSGRISMNFRGWAEIDELTLNKNPSELTDTLSDGRYFLKHIPDVHFEKGMNCIDCHSSYELMGDGTIYRHKEEAVTISCEDCHSNKQTIKFKDIDPESGKFIKIRNQVSDKASFLIEQKSGRAILSMIVENGEINFLGKISGKKMSLKALSPVCIGNKSHGRLSCSSCHTSWAPVCVGCHTTFEGGEEAYDHLKRSSIKGAWLESTGFSGPYPPALGIFRNIRNREGIYPAVPGMVLSIDGMEGEKPIFQRLYSPVLPHTITASGRDCESCHNDPFAMGFGRGRLEFYFENGKYRIKNYPYYESNKNDGLPEDAWIATESFSVGKSTRDFFFSPDSVMIEKMITAGACISCHKEQSFRINLLNNFDVYYSRRKNECQ